MGQRAGSGGTEWRRARVRRLLDRLADRQRGASMVEYSLVVAVLVVGSLGAIQFLNDQTEKESQNQAECVSTRPPPPDCQIPSAATTSTTVSGSVPPTSATSAPPPPPAPPPNVATWSGGVSITPAPPAPGPYTVNLPSVAVQTGDDIPTDVSGARVEVSIEVQDPTSGNWAQVASTSCTTGAGGTCTLPPVTIPDGSYPTVQNARVSVTSISTNPPVQTVPGEITFPWPGYRP